MYSFAPPSEGNLTHIAKHMRKQDADEVKASHGYLPRQALKVSVEQSVKSTVILYKERPLAIFGYGKLAPGDGRPWMLSSEDVVFHPKAALIYGRQGVSEMLQDCDYLANYVSESNLLSKKWLKKLGFTLSPAESYGIHGEKFHYFYMRSGACVYQG